MKWGAILAFAAGLAAAAWMIWQIGFTAILGAIAQAGFGGLALLSLYALGIFAVLAAAWLVLLPAGQRQAPSAFYLARLVRESITEISPFSPIGGMVAAARVMVLSGMDSGYAAASVAADATTEIMAQVAFLVLGLALGLDHFRHLERPIGEAMVAVLVLAAPAIAALIILQKKGADLAERLAGRFFPNSKRGVQFGIAIHALYESPSRLAAASALHLFAWIASGGGTFIAFRLVGGHLSLADAVALEAILCILRSLAAFVPAGLGVQEAGYAVLAPLFGVPVELGLAASLLKRAREVAIGIPALFYWQSLEGRKALAAPDLEEADG